MFPSPMTYKNNNALLKDNGLLIITLMWALANNVIAKVIKHGSTPLPIRSLQARSTIVCEPLVGSYNNEDKKPLSL